MNDLTHQSEQILNHAKQVRDDNRNGGRHRMASIGQGSKRIKRANWVKRIRNIIIAVGAIFVTAGIAGAVLNGIGFIGVMSVFIASIIAIAVLSNYPKVKTPKRADLAKGDLRQMVGKTELWLEHQRSELPPAAAGIVDDMGVQLDSLGVQLETVDQSHPAIGEIRKLVGEVLPGTIDAYRNIPAHLRGERRGGERRGGATPDQQVTESLGKISREIDNVTRQLAEGSLDDLAIKTRYLDYKYNDGLAGDSGVPLPDFNATRTKAH
ncbi:hypothetical protein [Pontixanthobacter sp.]|uniref:hypothetical protein n=1 Tax=Pontixanthobacter sp. TaxID=2792078 RepID=UPI003C7C682F